MATEQPQGLTWEWDEPDNWHRTAARVFHRNGEKYEPIAQVQLSGWPRRIGLAHARLIAAAPELLKALKMVANAFKNDSHKRLFPGVFASVDAAIAKAEGK